MDDDNGLIRFFSEEDFFEGEPIPPELWSDYLEAPFGTCSVCGVPLERTVYEIQKAFTKRQRTPSDRKGGEKPRGPSWETVIEMACCLDCGRSLAVEYSQQSMEAIRKFLAERLRLDRPPELCNLCGEPFAAAPSYSCWALGRGTSLLFPVIHVCAFCEEKLESLLSEKTRRAHEEFVNKTFPGVPADLDFSPKILL